MFHIPGVEISLAALLFLGLSVGVLSGFTGVGGGFIVTPVLIVMGMPVELAVGTSLCWVFLNSIAGSIIHRNHGNSDMKLGFVMALPSILGVEVGVRLADLARSAEVQDVAILSVSILLMVFIGAYTLAESLSRKKDLDRIGKARSDGSHQPTLLARRFVAIKLPPVLQFKRSGLSISAWAIFFLGFILGVITGFLGIGGGFVIVPALVYLLGLSSLLAVGTSTFQIVLSSFYGGLRYFLNGDVVIPVALAILSTSIPGVILGASVTKFVRGVAVRIVLGIMIVIVCIGSIFKLSWLISDKTISSLEFMANIIILAGMLFLVVVVLSLKWIARRYRMRKRIPRIFEALFHPIQEEIV
jgi:uncharacterized membrane protein YfcA